MKTFLKHFCSGLNPVDLHFLQSLSCVNPVSSDHFPELHRRVQSAVKPLTLPQRPALHFVQTPFVNSLR